MLAVFLGPLARDGTGCGSPAGSAVGDSHRASASPTAPRQRACLPVVSEECGCAYACSVGSLDPASASQVYVVQSELWDDPVRATVADWCVGQQCTLAFHADLVCDGICERRPADATCAFQEGGRCGTGRVDAVLDGAYQVRWSRDGAVAGVLALENGRYHWTGRAPRDTESSRTFVFVQRPHGVYRARMHPDVAGRPLDSFVGSRTTLAQLDFAPDDPTVPERERLVEVRLDSTRGVRFLHSTVSELETWTIETLPLSP